MVTIKDIARAAKVSVSTASRALNNNARISVATRQRVQKIAKDMGYVPNDTARNLSRGESNMVGLVLPVTSEKAPANPFHLDLMRGISAALTPLHYAMALAIGQSRLDLLSQVKSLVEGSKVRNFIVFYTMENDPVTAYFRSEDINFVVIGHPTQGHTDRFVDSDNVRAGQAATSELLNRYPQVKHPVFLKSAQNWRYEQDREQGYGKEMQKRGLTSQVFDTPDDEVKLKTILAPDSPIDGLIAADDLVYLHVIHAAHKYHCYKEIPTICFNNSRLLGMLMPDIERVDLLPRQIGETAVKVLFDPQQHEQLIDFEIKQ
mgnify:CR=1 FL=1